MIGGGVILFKASWSWRTDHWKSTTIEDDKRLVEKSCFYKRWDFQGDFDDVCVKMTLDGWNYCTGISIEFCCGHSDTWGFLLCLTDSHQKMMSEIWVFFWVMVPWCLFGGQGCMKRTPNPSFGHGILTVVPEKGSNFCWQKPPLEQQIQAGTNPQQYSEVGFFTPRFLSLSSSYLCLRSSM